MDAVGIASAPYVGYSMGGLIGLRFLALFPDRITRLALGGVGETYLKGPRVSDPERREMIADALLTADKDSITDPRARMFRDFAEQQGKDRLALAACMRAMSRRLCRLRFCSLLKSPSWWWTATRISWRGRLALLPPYSSTAPPQSCPAATICRRWAHVPPARPWWISSKV